MCPQQRLILVVDDDHAIRESLCELLEDEGYSVAKAGDGQEALNLLQRVGVPCLILLDLMMPVMDGYEFIGRKLADPALVNIPLVIITAAGPSKTASVTHPVLAKPVRADTLISTVKQYC